MRGVVEWVVEPRRKRERSDGVSETMQHGYCLRIRVVGPKKYFGKNGRQQQPRILCPAHLRHVAAGRFEGFDLPVQVRNGGLFGAEEITGPQHVVDGRDKLFVAVAAGQIT